MCAGESYWEVNIGLFFWWCVCFFEAVCPDTRIGWQNLEFHWSFLSLAGGAVSGSVACSRCARRPHFAAKFRFVVISWRWCALLVSRYHTVKPALPPVLLALQHCALLLKALASFDGLRTTVFTNRHTLCLQTFKGDNTQMSSFTLGEYVWCI